MTRDIFAKYTMPHRITGFSLIELLVAMAVFAIMAALAYGGLNSIAHTRGDLAKREHAFHDLMRTIGAFDRDLREAVARPVRGNFGQVLPAFVGTSDHLEFTRIGFANPQAEPRSNLERVLFELDAGRFTYGRYPVLDRAPQTQAQMVDSPIVASDFHLRYLDAGNQWFDAWPPPRTTDLTLIPRAVQWRLKTHDYGEIGRTIELVSAWPTTAAGAQLGGNGATTPPIIVAPPGATK